MKAIFPFALATLALLGASHAQAQVDLKPVASITIPHFKEGDFDHFAIDLAGHRLFLTSEANGAVSVFDTTTNTLVRNITGLTEPHSMLYRGDLHRLFVVDGGASEVKIYNSDTYALVGHIKLTVDADSIAYDPKTTYLYVVNGGREAKTPYSMISVIDTTKATKVADIKVDSQWLEALNVEHDGDRLFISETGDNKVGVMDRNTRKMIGAWPIPSGTEQNSPMIFDDADHRLFIVTRKNPKFLVMNSDNGKEVASMDCAPMVDDIAYDPTTKRIYLSGTEVINVIQEKDADHYEKVGDVKGDFRAKTALVVPQLQRYYLAVPKHGTGEARVQVFSTAH